MRFYEVWSIHFRVYLCATSSRQHILDRGEKAHVVHRESTRNRVGQGSLAAPLHQQGEIVCQELLGVNDVRGVFAASAPANPW